MAQPVTHVYTLVTVKVASVMKMLYTQETTLKIKSIFGKKPLFLKETETTIDSVVIYFHPQDIH